MAEQQALPTSYAFIGLGAMGYPMATNLCRSLPQLTTFCVYDINSTVADKFCHQFPSRAVSIATSCKDASERAQCVISIVPEGKDVEKVYLDPQDGVLAASESKGKIMIDCSTIDVATSMKVANAALSSSISLSPAGNGSTGFFDAPVSGGVAAAAKGTLTMMIGVDEKNPIFGVIKQIMTPIGRHFFACGKQGSGLICKLSNNYLSGLCAIATSEAMNIGMHYGIDPKLLSSIFAVSSGGNWVNSNCNPVPGVCPDSAPSHDYQGGFKVQLMLKDFGLAVEAARTAGINLSLGQSGLDVYAGASVDPRCRDRDSRVVYRYLGGKE